MLGHRSARVNTCIGHDLLRQAAAKVPLTCLWPRDASYVRRLSGRDSLHIWDTVSIQGGPFAPHFMLWIRQRA